MKTKLFSSEILTSLLKVRGIEDWNTAIRFIQNLSYGRNKNRHNLQLVVTEEKGTCSSKHAFLKQLADENKLKEVELFIGIYKMTQKNTPKIGSILVDTKLTYIPEAHCYLKIDGVPLDVTSATSNFSLIEPNILREIKILPFQISEDKVDIHRNYINEWLISEEINETFERVWALREQCIERLTIS